MSDEDGEDDEKDENGEVDEETSGLDYSGDDRTDEDMEGDHPFSHSVGVCICHTPVEVLWLFLCCMCFIF